MNPIWLDFNSIKSMYQVQHHYPTASSRHVWGASLGAYVHTTVRFFLAKENWLNICLREGQSCWSSTVGFGVGIESDFPMSDFMYLTNSLVRCRIVKIRHQIWHNSDSRWPTFLESLNLWYFMFRPHFVACVPKTHKNINFEFIYQ